MNNSSKDTNESLKEVLRKKLHEDHQLHSQKDLWLKKTLGNKKEFSLSSLFTLPYLLPGVLSVFLVVVSLKNFQSPIGFQSSKTLKATLAYHNSVAPNMELRAELDEIITNASLEYADESEALNEEILGE